MNIHLGSLSKKQGQKRVFNIFNRVSHRQNLNKSLREMTKSLHKAVFASACRRVLRTGKIHKFAVDGA